jgi:ABC-type transport system involved in cytochrome c biogenesis permease component
VLAVAVGDLQKVLNGGTISLLGRNLRLLGLRTSRDILRATIASLPPRSPLRSGLQQVADFASSAITGLGFASPVLGSIGTPLTVERTDLSGKTTPSDSYAVAIAVIVSLMFVTLLLAAGLLAMEREEHTFGRLVRGLVTRTGLLTEKIVLAAGCAALVTLVMAMGVSAFVHVEWSRFPLWIVALAFGGLAFAALGVAIGGLAREVRAASLLAFLLSLPIAFVALVPANAVSGTLKDVLDVIAALFPFKASLQAMDNALNGGGPSLLGSLAHLTLLALAFGALGRLALRRFA